MVHLRGTGDRRVYRLGTPGWTLAPIGLALLVFGLAAVLGSRLDLPRRGSDSAAGSRVPSHLAGDRPHDRVGDRPDAGLHGHAAGRGTALIDLPQIAGYVRQWYPILVTSGIGAVGLLLSIVACRDAALGGREALEDLWLATICGLPLVILVIGVGEPPRNYLAQLSIGAGIAAAGWLWLFEPALRRWPSPTILAVGALFGPILGAAVADVFGVGSGSA